MLGLCWESYMAQNSFVLHVLGSLQMAHVNEAVITKSGQTYPTELHIMWVIK